MSRTFSLTNEKQDVPAFAKCLPAGRDLTKFAIFGGLSVLFFFLSFITLPYVVLSPSKFAIFFSFGIVSLLIAFAFLNGP